MYIKGGYINESVHVNSRCYRIKSNKCDYRSTCYNTTIVRLNNAELAYYITIESGKQIELYNCLTSYNIDLYVYSNNSSNKLVVVKILPRGIPNT